MYIYLFYLWMIWHMPHRIINGFLFILKLFFEFVHDVT
jgi:hypothetical protein